MSSCRFYFLIKNHFREKIINFSMPSVLAFFFMSNPKSLGDCFTFYVFYWAWLGSNDLNFKGRLSTKKKNICFPLAICQPPLTLFLMLKEINPLLLQNFRSKFESQKQLYVQLYQRSPMILPLSVCQYLSR